MRKLSALLLLLSFNALSMPCHAIESSQLEQDIELINSSKDLKQSEKDCLNSILGLNSMDTDVGYEVDLFDAFSFCNIDEGVTEDTIGAE